MNSPVRTILVRAPNWIGDQIIAYPFFYHLRAAFPQARITSVCVPWVEAIQFRNLVDEIYVLPQVGKSFLTQAKSLGSAARGLRCRGPWDLGISLPNSFSAAWLLFRAGVKTRRGYRNDARSFLLNDGLPRQSSEDFHRAQIFLGLLPDGATAVKSAPEFWDHETTNSERQQNSSSPPLFDPAISWPQADPLEPPATPFWVVAPGSMAESRRWPIEDFATFAKLAHNQTGWKGLIIGGSSETPLASKLTQLTGEILSDYTARGTASSYWKIFRAAKFTLSNDSGLAHVAAICGEPKRSLVQIVWGAGVPERTQPLGPSRVQVLFNRVDCWPCERNYCFQSAAQKLKCLKGIEPAAVWRQIEQGISNN